MARKKNLDYDEIFSSMFDIMNRKLTDMGFPLPSVSLIAEEDSDPYRILTSTMLSLRTKDSVTLSSSMRLFSRAKNFRELENLPEETVAELIYPTAFYRRKAAQLQKIAHIINEQYGGTVPNDLDALMALPGVGIKTASLTLNLGYGADAICVDCHVHEVLNRTGIIDTKTPEETEQELRKILPRRFWIPLNEALVRYGQAVCTPMSPHCSECPYIERCKQSGVTKSR